MTSVAGIGYKARVPGGVASTPGRPHLLWRFDMTNLRGKSPKVKCTEQTELPLDAAPTWWIYVLCDPRETDPVQRVRYVGVTTKSVGVRLSGHLHEARHFYDTRGGRQTHKANWIRSLLDEGVLPVAEVVDCGVGERSWQSLGLRRGAAHQCVQYVLIQNIERE